MMIAISSGVGFKIYLLNTVAGEANQVAHNLARRAQQCKQNYIWVDETLVLF